MPIRGDQVLAAAVLEEITQAAHGFTQRQVLAHNGTSWLLADASDQATRARGVVVEVLDANTFVIGFDGLYDEEAAHGLTVGEDYYLSTTPGALTLVQDGIIQHVLTVVSTTAYLLKLFDPVKPYYIFDRKADNTYYGFIREDDGRWLIKLQTIAPNGAVTEVYADMALNPGYATLDLAWPDRAILTYDPDAAVAGGKQVYYEFPLYGPDDGTPAYAFDGGTIPNSVNGGMRWDTVTNQGPALFDLNGARQIRITTDGVSLPMYLELEGGAVPVTPPAAGRVRLYAIDEHNHDRVEHMDRHGTRHRMGRDVTLIAKNVAGVQVDKGQMVYINGAVGASSAPTVALAQANLDVTANNVHVAMEDVAHNAFGSFMKIGIIRGVDTATPGWSDGTTLFLDFAVAGGLTSVEPLPPYPVVFVGTVISSHAINGSIQFNIGTRINPYKPGLYPTPSGRVALTADVDDLALIAYPTPSVQFYIDPDADGWIINSIVSDGRTRLIRLTNVDAVFGFVIADEGTGTAANRVITGQGGPVTVPPLATAILAYDVADSRWRLDAVASGAVGGFPEAIGFMGW